MTSLDQELRYNVMLRSCASTRGWGDAYEHRDACKGMEWGMRREITGK